MLLRGAAALLACCSALLLPPPAAAQGNNGGTGCQQRLSAVCGNGWKTDPEKCLGCVQKHIAELKPNCTLKRAEKKCTDPSAPPPAQPLPSGPAPLPPLPPAAGAARPHVVLFVIDDMGHASMGYQNAGNVHTPHFDAEAGAGIKLLRHCKIVMLSWFVALSVSLTPKASPLQTPSDGARPPARR